MSFSQPISNTHTRPWPLLCQSIANVVPILFNQPIPDAHTAMGFRFANQLPTSFRCCSANRYPTYTRVSGILLCQPIACVVPMSFSQPRSDIYTRFWATALPTDCQRCSDIVQPTDIQHTTRFWASALPTDCQRRPDVVQPTDIQHSFSNIGWTLAQCCWPTFHWYAYLIIVSNVGLTLAQRLLGRWPTVRTIADVGPT